MKRLLGIILSLTLIVPSFAVKVKADSATEAISYNYSYDFNNGYDKSENHIRQMEKLDRGLIAIRTNEGVYLSWRLLDSEDNIYGSANSNVSFNVYRDNTKITTVSKATCYTDTEAGTSYSVAPVINGHEGEKCTAVSVKDNSYFDIPLDRPAAQHLPKVVSYKLSNESKATNHFTNSDSSSLTDDNILASWKDENAVWIDYDYTIGDCSTGDVDGDGEYEIIVKWDCNSQDNSLSGVTGNVYLDAYKQNGKKLWRVNLGKNIRSGAHYTQFLVYDFDGDGKAEMTCRTAPGSKDSKGNYVTSASHVDEIKNITDEINEADYRNDGGYILSGDEYLTVFDGLSGEAVDTIYYPNQLVSASVWGDTYGNRCDRFTADVAYMDGEKPYAVYMRGYYFGNNKQQRQTACAVSFENGHLNCKYSFDTYDVNTYRNKSTSSSYHEDGTYKGVNGYESGNEIYVGQGNHNCTVADVNNDGRDEVITGALCYWINPETDTLSPKWCTFKEHGDALHIGDYDPTHQGFEFFTVHEDGNAITSSDNTDEKKLAKQAGPDGIVGTDDDYGYVQENAAKAGKNVICNFGMSLIDADTGEILFHKGNTKDTGRGCMANTGSGGYYQITGVGSYQCNGDNNFTSTSNGAGSNFRIFWDGDLYDELLDGTNTYDNRGRFSAISVTSWNGKSISSIFNIPTDCVAINGTKANPALQADLFGDWREEVIYPVSSNDALRVFSTTTPTDYKIKTLMHDPVYRSGVAAEQTAYNQPPHVGFYMGEEVFKAKVISITAEVLNNTFILGESFDKSKIKVTADYSDGSQEEISNYAIAGFDSSQEGEQQVVITYLGQSASFTANVKGASISDINGNYTTASASLSRNKIPITNSEGYNGSFVIEHTFTLNSFPQNGTYDKKDEAGFFVRFQPNSGTGGGWSIRKTEDNKYEVFWKSASAMAIPSSTADTTVLNLGETYNFKYIFTKVATGEGALVQLIISDLQGNTISNKSALPLRNMTNDDQKVNPLKYIEITNQAAAEGTTASFSIENARLYGNSTINNITGNLVNITLNNFASTSSVFAAKYNTNNELIQITKFDYTQDGTFSWELPFEPDKVFIWEENMVPIDFKTK